MARYRNVKAALGIGVLFLSISALAQSDNRSSGRHDRRDALVRTPNQLMDQVSAHAFFNQEISADWVDLNWKSTELLPSERREILIRALENLRHRRLRNRKISPEKVHELESMFRSFRVDQRIFPGLQLSIAHGPYAGFLLYNYIDEVYASEYTRIYQVEYEKTVIDPDNEYLFDILLELVVKEQIPDGLADGDFAEVLDDVDSSIALRAFRAIDKNCYVDYLDPRKADQVAELQRKVNSREFKWPPEDTPERRYWEQVRDFTDSSKAYLSTDQSVGLFMMWTFGGGWGLDLCAVRRKAFAGFIESFMPIRTNPEIWPGIQDVLHQEFKKIYADIFYTEGLAEISRIVADVPRLLSRKFKGDFHQDYWFAAPLIEVSLDESFVEPSLHPLPDNSAVFMAMPATLDDFSKSLRADLMMAELFLSHDSFDSEKFLNKADQLHQDQQISAWNGIASPLFFASANKFLLLTGGDMYVWDQEDETFNVRGSMLVDYNPEGHVPSETVNPTDYPIARKPVFERRKYGGVCRAAELKKTKTCRWDWENYDPTTHNRFRIFPSEFALGQTGQIFDRHEFVREKKKAIKVRPYQSIRDLSNLLAGVSEFLRLTRDGGVLSPYLGQGAPNEVMENMLDPNDPTVFPAEGRMLAYGVLGGVLKNLINEDLLEISHIIPPEKGIEFDYRNLVYLISDDEFSQPPLTREQAPPLVDDVAKLLMNAARIYYVLESDEQAPAALRDMRVDLKNAIVTAIVRMAVMSQEPDGGFRPYFKDSEEDKTVTRDKGLHPTVNGLRALMTAYSLVGFPIIAYDIRQALQYLEELWIEHAWAPIDHSNGEGLKPHDILDLWDLVNFWREFSSELLTDPELNEVIDFEKFNRQIKNLEKNLQDIRYVNKEL